MSECAADFHGSARIVALSDARHKSLRRFLQGILFSTRDGQRYVSRPAPRLLEGLDFSILARLCWCGNDVGAPNRQSGRPMTSRDREVESRATAEAVTGNSAARLAAAVLDEEARRQIEQAERDKAVLFPDDLLPGVGDEPMTLREAMIAGGKTTVVMLFLLNFIDDLPRAVRVIGPDIQNSLNISDTVLAGVLGFGGVALVLGAVPMAALADRVRRVAIIPVGDDGVVRVHSQCLPAFLDQCRDRLRAGVQNPGFQLVDQ